MTWSPESVALAVSRRYHRDAEFHAEVQMAVNLIVAATPRETPQIAVESLTMGAATALYLRDEPQVRSVQ